MVIRAIIRGSSASSLLMGKDVARDACFSPPVFKRKRWDRAGLNVAQHAQQNIKYILQFCYSNLKQKTRMIKLRFIQWLRAKLPRSDVV